MTSSTATGSDSTSLIFSIATAAASLVQSSSFIPSPSAIITSQSSGSGNNGENNGECRLLGPFAVLVQAALGALALLSLVYKRWRERPQRPVKIWAFDASKQVVGSVLLHLANLVMSMFSAGQLEQSLAAAAAKAAANAAGANVEAVRQPNPCSFYLLNLAIDTTIGIPILIIILKVLTIGASYTPLANPPESIMSGNYGEPPHVAWWLKQSLVYFLGLLGMKTCVFIVFQLCPWIVQVGDWALRWTEGNEAIQVAFVMLIFPLIMNALQYYIIDTFIKKPIPKDELDQHADEGNEAEHGGLLSEDHDDRQHSLDDDDDGSDNTLHDNDKRNIKTSQTSYDPDKDGDVVAEHAESSTSPARTDLTDRPRI